MTTAPKTIPDSVVEAALAVWRTAGDHPMRRALEAAAPMLGPQWIKCSERMPNYGERVLIHVPKYHKDRQVVLAVCCSAFFDHRDIRLTLNMVSGWQPLPQPPKEQA